MKAFFRAMDMYHPSSDAAKANRLLVAAVKAHPNIIDFFKNERLNEFTSRSQRRNIEGTDTIRNYFTYIMINNKRDGTIQMALPSAMQPAGLMTRGFRTARKILGNPVVGWAGGMLASMWTLSIFLPTMTAFNDPVNARLVGASRQIGFSFWGNILSSDGGKKAVQKAEGVMAQMNTPATAISDEEAKADVERLLEQWQGIFQDLGEQLSPPQHTVGQALVNDLATIADQHIQSAANTRRYIQEHERMLRLNRYQGAEMDPQTRQEIEMELKRAQRDLSLTIARVDVIRRTWYPFIKESNQDITRFFSEMGYDEMVRLSGGVNSVREAYTVAFSQALQEGAIAVGRIQPTGDTSRPATSRE